jgi:hypothetical protein
LAEIINQPLDIVFDRLGNLLLFGRGLDVLALDLELDVELD